MAVTGLRTFVAKIREGLWFFPLAKISVKVCLRRRQRWACVCPYSASTTKAIPRSAVFRRRSKVGRSDAFLSAAINNMQGGSHDQVGYLATKFRAGRCRAYGCQLSARHD